jgi:hypothetical protein
LSQPVDLTKPSISKLASSEWKSDWDKSVFYKLHNISRCLDKLPPLNKVVSMVCTSIDLSKIKLRFYKPWGVT